jgi:hypothetical protein
VSDARSLINSGGASGRGTIGGVRAVLLVRGTGEPTDASGLGLS